MELEESTYLISGSATKPQLSRQYGTGAVEKWYLIVVLIWASLMTHGVGHLYTECWS